MTHKVAVIGAGMAGLSCARTLRRAGCFVELFERERWIAWRMATQRFGGCAYDHGAQYITARSADFRSYVEELVSDGYARAWEPRIAMEGDNNGRLLPWYVGMPGMSSLVRPLAEGVQVSMGRCVHTISRDPKGWLVWFDDETKAGPFSAVAIAVPAPEAALLLGPLDEMANTVSRVRMTPCWSLSLRLDSRVLPEFDVYSDMSQVVRWVSRNDSKPGRRVRGETIVVHASQMFSRETEDADPDDIAEELWAEVCHVLNLPPVRPEQMSAHLWRHSLADSLLGESYVFSSEHNVGMAGDWCLGRLGEHAFNSGQSLGRAMINALD